MRGPVSLRVVKDEEPSIGATLRQIVDDVGQLARTEVNLAKAEVTANIAKLVRPIVMIAMGALLGIAALFTLMGALVGFLTPYVGAGWAALIVAAVVGGIAALLVMSGIKAIGAVTLAPKRSVASVKADVAAVKEAAK